jgi:hypothetical protein
VRHSRMERGKGGFQTWDAELSCAFFTARPGSAAAKVSR